MSQIPYINLFIGNDSLTTGHKSAPITLAIPSINPVCEVWKYFWRGH